MRENKTIFLVLTFISISVIATELVFYLLDPLLPYDLQPRISSLTDRFIAFTVRDILEAVIFFSFLIVQVLSIRHSINRIVKRDKDLMHSL